MKDDHEIAEQVIRSLRQIIRRVSVHSKHLSREVGLTLPQLICLKSIGQQENEGLTVAKVANDVSLSPPTVSRIVDRLEKAGLVLRERRSDDRRKVCISLTPAGFERYQTLPIPLQERFLERLMELEPDHRLELLHSLQQISEMMEATKLDAAPLLAPGDDVKEGSV